MKSVNDIKRELEDSGDFKAVTVADMIDSLQQNGTSREDMAAEVEDMGEWGKRAAQELRGPKIKEESEYIKTARLHAAAPELLEALERVSEYMVESHTEVIEQEFYGCEDKQERHEKEEPECTYCAAIKQARAAIAKAENGTGEKC